MSQTFPDVPELQPIPPVIRGLVWMRATMHAVRSAETWLLFVASQVVLIGAAATAGLQVLSVAGAALGGLVGAALALYLLFRVIIPWQARRYLRTAGRHVDWAAQFSEIVEAQNRIEHVTKKL